MSQSSSLAPMAVCPHGRFRADKGIALLITLTVITVLISVALEINRRVRNTVISTAVSRDVISLSEMTASAIQVGMAVLVQHKEDSRVDSIQDTWAEPEKLTPLLEMLDFGKGEMGLEISDELGKIQINALVAYPQGREFNESQRRLWERLFLGLATQVELKQEIRPSEIINSVKDWLDFGDDDLITGLDGAETNYYRGLETPYAPANGPFTHLSELALVKGVTPELFEQAFGEFGLAEFMTVFGLKTVEKNNFTFEGKININTADLPVIAALLPVEYVGLAVSIYDYRVAKDGTEYQNNLSDPNWYKNAPGCAEITIDPNLITTQSTVFRITARAKLSQTTMTMTSVVHLYQDTDTRKWRCQLLTTEIE